MRGTVHAAFWIERSTVAAGSEAGGHRGFTEGTQSSPVGLESRERWREGSPHPHMAHFTSFTLSLRLRSTEVVDLSKDMCPCVDFKARQSFLTTLWFLSNKGSCDAPLCLSFPCGLMPCSYSFPFQGTS